MDWEAIGAIGELLGAISVLATLVYVALQVRDARKLLLVNTYQSRTDRNLHLASLRIEHPEFAIIGEKLRAGKEVTEDELNHYRSYWQSMMRHFEEIHVERELGLIDDHIWNAVLQGLRNNKGSPRFEELWSGGFGYRQPFVDLISRLDKAES